MRDRTQAMDSINKTFVPSVEKRMTLEVMTRHAWFREWLDEKKPRITSTYQSSDDVDHRDLSDHDIMSGINNDPIGTPTDPRPCQPSSLSQGTQATRRESRKQE